jgi:predicted transcriptional regulator of viral defense system
MRAIKSHAKSVKSKASPLKTVGPRTAQLTAALYDRSRTTFTLADVQTITALSHASARSLVRNAVARGLVTRLKPGLFVLVPPELGSVSEFAGNPYIIARELVADARYYISHASAMELHGMLTQPKFVVFASAAKRLRGGTIHGTEFRFVFVRPEQLFGVTNHWVTKQESVRVSDLERTVIDGLRRPEYCGGVTEVAKGMWIRRSDLNPNRLIDYALRLGVGAVIRRLGYLLDLYQLASGRALNRLRRVLTATYVVLDPSVPGEGPHLASWRLRVNVPPEELEAVRSA